MFMHCFSAGFFSFLCLTPTLGYSRSRFSVRNLILSQLEDLAKENKIDPHSVTADWTPPTLVAGVFLLLSLEYTVPVLGDLKRVTDKHPALCLFKDIIT